MALVRLNFPTRWRRNVFILADSNSDEIATAQNHEPYRRHKGSSYSIIHSVTKNMQLQERT